MAVKSVERAFQLLELISKNDWGMRFTDIFEAAKIPKGTAFNILATLEKIGMLRKDPESLRYRIGVSAIAIGNAYFRGFDIRREAYPDLVWLSKKRGETVNLAAFINDEVYFIESVGYHDYKPLYWSDTPLGRPAPAYSSAVGKVYLSHLTDSELNTYLKKTQLKAYSSKTITSVRALRLNLYKSRKEGFALDDEELSPGVRCIAAAIYNLERKPYGAVSLTSSVEKLHDKIIPSVSKDVMEAARRISIKLGWSENLK